MKNKKIIVEKIPFERGFLDPIKSFVPSADFVPIYFLNGKLVSFCSNRQENGTLALYSEHIPIKSNMEEGDVFFIREPQKLLSAVKMISDDKILIEFSDYQISCKTKTYRFKFSLYDKNLAKRNKIFWKPEKFNKIKDNFEGFIKINKGDISDLKTSSNIIDEDVVTIINDEEEDEMTFMIGSDKSNSISINLPYSDNFTERNKFIKNMFSFLGKHDVELVQTKDEKVIGFIEKDEENSRYYIVTTIN